MMDNIKPPLIKSIEENLEIETYNYGEVEIDAEVLLNTVIEESLSRTVQLTSTISTTSMASIQNVARKNSSHASTSIQR
jgi:hypothetical protein